ncbi:MAG: hypothetical protein P1P63_05630, partial [Treponemataceae bacterium]
MPFGKRRVLYAVSHYVAKRRKINNPQTRNIVCTFSASLAKVRQFGNPRNLMIFTALLIYRYF